METYQKNTVKSNELINSNNDKLININNDKLNNINNVKNDKINRYFRTSKNKHYINNKNFTSNNNKVQKEPFIKKSIFDDSSSSSDTIEYKIENPFHFPNSFNDALHDSKRKVKKQSSFRKFFSFTKSSSESDEEEIMPPLVYSESESDNDDVILNIGNNVNNLDNINLNNVNNLENVNLDNVNLDNVNDKLNSYLNDDGESLEDILNQIPIKLDKKLEETVNEIRELEKQITYYSNLRKVQKQLNNIKNNLELELNEIKKEMSELNN